MEDARFVLFTDDDGSQRYYATYTAFDGHHIDQHLLVTDDFVRFDVSPVVGAAATNKGLALFPRRIDGRYVALSRCDRETNAITTSDDIHRWDEVTSIQVPERSWEIIQLGNCGSPIETDAGWLPSLVAIPLALALTAWLWRRLLPQRRTKPALS